ncbi:MAG: hypothetical protein Q8Q35_02455 [Nanoarchaeota archaeon]|nr:hypothetical protein [Nanoarchaeota archaeon]
MDDKAKEELINQARERILAGGSRKDVRSFLIESGLIGYDVTEVYDAANANFKSKIKDTRSTIGRAFPLRGKGGADDDESTAIFELDNPQSAEDSNVEFFFDPNSTDDDDKHIYDTPPVRAKSPKKISPTTRENTATFQDDPSTITTQSGDTPISDFLPKLKDFDPNSILNPNISRNVKVNPEWEDDPTPNFDDEGIPGFGDTYNLPQKTKDRSLTNSILAIDDEIGDVSQNNPSEEKIYSKNPKSHRGLALGIGASAALLIGGSLGYVTYANDTSSKLDVGAPMDTGNLEDLLITNKKIISSSPFEPFYGDEITDESLVAEDQELRPWLYEKVASVKDKTSKEELKPTTEPNLEVCLTDVYETCDVVLFPEEENNFCDPETYVIPKTQGEIFTYNGKTLTIKPFKGDVGLIAYTTLVENHRDNLESLSTMSTEAQEAAVKAVSYQSKTLPQKVKQLAQSVVNQNPKKVHNINLTSADGEYNIIYPNEALTLDFDNTKVPEPQSLKLNTIVKRTPKNPSTGNNLELSPVILPRKEEEEQTYIQKEEIIPEYKPINHVTRKLGKAPLMNRVIDEPKFIDELVNKPELPEFIDNLIVEEHINLNRDGSTTTTKAYRPEIKISVLDDLMDVYTGLKTVEDLGMADSNNSTHNVAVNIAREYNHGNRINLGYTKEIRLSLGAQLAASSEIADKCDEAYVPSLLQIARIVNQGADLEEQVAPYEISNFAKKTYGVSRRDIIKADAKKKKQTVFEAWKQYESTTDKPNLLYFSRSGIADEVCRAEGTVRNYVRQAKKENSEVQYANESQENSEPSETQVYKNLEEAAK